MKITGIYVIINTINNKYYVGSSIDIDKRWTQHRSDLDLNKHYNTHLQNAWNKYGFETFTWEIICEVPEDKLLQTEQIFIDSMWATNRHYGYNIATIAGSCRGIKRSEETKHRMSEAQQGNKHCLGKKLGPHSEESKCKMREACKGRIPPSRKGTKLSKEHKQKISMANRGQKRSKEQKIKISIAKKGQPSPNKGKPMREEQKEKIRKIWENKKQRNKEALYNPLINSLPTTPDV